MTREEEKIVALNNYIHETSSSGCEVVKENAFIAGFEIADKTMLDRACEWLELRVSEDFPVDTNECGMPFCESWIKAQEERIKAMKEFITAFRQAMEGGAE